MNRIESNRTLLVCKIVICVIPQSTVSIRVCILPQKCAVSSDYTCILSTLLALHLAVYQCSKHLLLLTFLCLLFFLSIILVDTPDPYVTLELPNAPEKMKRTKTVKDSHSPDWNETFVFHFDPAVPDNNLRE